MARKKIQITYFKGDTSPLTVRVVNSEFYDDYWKYWIIRKSDNINDSGILLNHKAVDVVIK